MPSMPGQTVGAEFDDALFHKQLLDNLFDGVYFVDGDRRIRYWNRGAERLTGYTPGEAIGRKCSDNFLCHMDEKGALLCHDRCPLVRAMDSGAVQETEVSLRHKSGERVFVCVRVSPMSDAGGNIIGATEVFTEVTARTRIERRVRQLQKLAFVDELTQLPNRRFMEVRLRQKLELLREFGKSAGVLLIDIDRFKTVNDTFGHQSGDEVLRAVSHTLVRAVRPTDIVGRWGGEEFVVILLGISADTLHFIAERCRTFIAEMELSKNEQRFQVTISIGATLIGERDSVDAIIQRADQLLYRSKQGGRNRTTVG